MEKIRASVYLPVSPETLFNAWMDSREHSAFTGDTAKISHAAGGKFSAFSGYITGKTLELRFPSRIVQQWRTTEFPEDAEDSILNIIIEPHGKGSNLILEHTHIPEGQGARYKRGWKDFYFEPMKIYFS